MGYYLNADEINVVRKMRTLRIELEMFFSLSHRQWVARDRSQRFLARASRSLSGQRTTKPGFSKKSFSICLPNLQNRLPQLNISLMEKKVQGKISPHTMYVVHCSIKWKDIQCVWMGPKSGHQMKCTLQHVTISNKKLIFAPGPSPRQTASLYSSSLWSQEVKMIMVIAMINTLS